MEIWERGPVSVAWERGSRAAYNALRDPLWRRKILLVLLAIGATTLLLRAVVRAMAANIARKQYTQELVHKNRELQDLIQEVNRTQQQLIHSEKLAALGQLVAGIAHELNNPIGFIYANMFQIRKYLDSLERGPLDDQARAVVRKIDQALRDSQDGSIRIRDIVQNLRGLSRAGSPGPGPGNILRKRPCDVNQLLDKSLLLAQTNFSKNILVRKDYGQVPLIEADETQIQQVVLNVLVNAGQALEEKGAIIIRTRAAAGMAVISISDDGPGISPENLQHLFEPFFTTKPVGQGIGLGLHICYQIISAHQGKIEAGPAQGGGAEFLIQLPLTETKEIS
jgi:signal transduction histidine kinase